MKPGEAWLVEYLQGWQEGWNRFWFTPRDPATLGLIRILAGLMLSYTHLVWGMELSGFIGPQGRLSPEYIRLLYASEQFPTGNPYAWSHLYLFESTGALTVVHWAAVVVLLLFTAGLWTRVTSVLAFLITVSYSHRLASAQFGLDQINGMLAMYLMIAPCGQAYSLDRLWQRRRLAGVLPPVQPTTMANVATRLMQIHLCIIYLFAGTGKLLGETWWDGTALWGAIANQEYQTFDLTWLATYPLIVNALTHLTVAWEVGYCVMIWRPGLRPWMLALAIPLHAGIGLCMGMVTFGLVMLIANLAFVEPQLVRWWLGGGGRGRGAEEQGDETEYRSTAVARGSAR